MKRNLWCICKTIQYMSLTLPLWALIVICSLIILSLYLTWKLRKCHCRTSGLEKFKGANDDVVDNENEDKVNEGEGEGEDKAIVVEKSVAKEVVKPKVSAVEGLTEDETEVEIEDQDEEPKTTTDKKTKTNSKSKSMKDKLLSYGEMKLFEGLRENSYSLPDIKRMIREGEISESMIEKFLARVEAMESGKKSSGSKVAHKDIEGFTGGQFASAMI